MRPATPRSPLVTMPRRRRSDRVIRRQPSQAEQQVQALLRAVEAALRAHDFAFQATQRAIERVAI